MKKITLLLLVVIAFTAVSCSKDETPTAQPSAPDYCTQEKKVDAKFEAFGTALAAQFQTSNPPVLKSATEELQTEIAAIQASVPAQIKTDYTALTAFLTQIVSSLSAIDYDISKASKDLQQQLSGDLPAPLQAAEERVNDYDATNCGIPKPTP